MDPEEYLRKAHALVADSYAAQVAGLEARFPPGINLKRSFLKGKHLRAALTLLTAQALNGRPEDAMLAACAVEMLHQSTLLHDDVLDKDERRRGDPASWVLNKIGRTILAGDAGFASAMNLIAQFGPQAVSLGANTLMLIAEGVLEEVMGKSIRDEPAYIKIAKLKTATLFSCACGLGAIVADSRYKELAKKYGIEIGTAYQVADDLVDLFNSIETGEAIGDLAEKRITYPLYAIWAAGPDLEDGVTAFLDGASTWPELLDAIGDEAQLRSIELVETQIEYRTAKAMYLAREFPFDNTYRDLLEKMPQFVVDEMKREML